MKKYVMREISDLTDDVIRFWLNGSLEQRVNIIKNLKQGEAMCAKKILFSGDCLGEFKEYINELKSNGLNIGKQNEEFGYNIEKEKVINLIVYRKR